MTIVRPEQSTPERILVVDDEPYIRQILFHHLTHQGYDCVQAGGSEQALEIVHRSTFDLVVTDIRMPGRDGVWLLHEIKSFAPDTAVLMITALDDSQIAVQCLKMGAFDYLIKPLHLEEVTHSVRNAIERRMLILENKRYQRELEQKVLERTAKLQQALDSLEAHYDNTLEALVAALDAREHETSNHSKRVAVYSRTLAQELGVSEPDQIEIYRGAFLHDIGKIGVADAILLKPGRLSIEEWDEMKRHPGIGHMILKQVSFLRSAVQTVLCHHERYDGTGYPQGLAGENIPIGARIFSVADAFDTMTSNRPYRKALTVERARDEVFRCAGTQFDPKVVEVFSSISMDRWLAIRTELQDRVILS